MLQSFDDIAAKLVVEERSFSSHVEVFNGILQEDTFKTVFKIEDEELNQYGAVLAEWMKIQHDPREYLRKLHWLTRALLQFQDVLSLVAVDAQDDSNELTNVLARHHCYYEGLLHLRSATISLLNANCNAAITSLRPIVERFTYSIYWDVMQEEGKAGRYNSWLQTGKGKPRFRDALSIIEKRLLQRRSRLSSRISKVFGGISGSYKVLCTWTHTPTINFSLATGGLSSMQGDLSDWLFCLHMFNITLANILHLYVYQYPMVLFPVDLIRKWGCKMPVGVFVDECAARIVWEALGERTAKTLGALLVEDEEVRAKLSHAKAFGGLTDEAIWETWEDFKMKSGERPKDLPTLAAQQKAQYRSMGWAFNYMPKKTDEEPLGEEIENAFRILY